MTPPRFFLSYARRDRDKYLDRFFADLRREVAFKEGLDKESDEAGFRDTQSINTGQDWSSRLADALREAWACVSLYTPRYFSRKYCGKEFQVFLDRSSVTYDEDGAAEDSRGIFPVLWASIRDLQRKALPPAIASRINFNGYEHQDRYEADGLRQILMKSPRGAYADILRHLADDMLDAPKGERPPPLPDRPSLHDIKNPFLVEQNELACTSEGRKTSGGPSRLVLFILAREESSGILGASLVQDTLHMLEDEEVEADAECINPSTAESAEVVKMLVQANDQNALAALLVDLSEYTDEQERLLAALLEDVPEENPTWSGAILIPRIPSAAAADLLCSQLCKSMKGHDNIIIRTLSGEQPEFLQDLKRVMLVLRKRVIEEGLVKRNLPGGGTPKERPKIQGPTKGGRDE